MALACYLFCHCLATASMNILPVAYTETLGMVWDITVCLKEGVVLSYTQTHTHTDKIAS